MSETLDIMDDYFQNSYEFSNKRVFGVLDPDYIMAPDRKRLKILEEKGNEELSDRVAKVIEREFLKEIKATETQLEDIDKKILKVQQCMYTLRCLNTLELCGDKQMVEKISKSMEQGKLLQDDQPSEQYYINSGTELPQENAEISTSQELETSEKISKAEPSNSQDQNIVLIKGAKLNIKLVPPVPHPPESKHVIAMGRQGQLRKKIRVIVGNTYQYLRDAEEIGNELKFKWRIYVRGPPDTQDIEEFISSVIFTLDKSYTPHDVIEICEYPFTVSRRGWGEFKVHLQLNFKDQRNKSVKLVHFLRLSRIDDPLALTGLWRLGEETWYDIWLNDIMENEGRPLPKSPIQTAEENTRQMIKALHSQGIGTETVYSDASGNFTLSHIFPFVEKHIGALKLCDKDLSSITSDVVPSTEGCSSHPIDKDMSVEDKIYPKFKKTERHSSQINEVYPRNVKNLTINGNNLIHLEKPQRLLTQSSLNSRNVRKSTNNIGTFCKILIRQADGKLVSCMVSREMYNMAMILSDKRAKMDFKKGQHPVAPHLKVSAHAAMQGNSKLSSKLRKFVLKTNGTINADVFQKTPPQINSNNAITEKVILPRLILGSHPADKSVGGFLQIKTKHVSLKRENNINSSPSPFVNLDLLKHNSLSRPLTDYAYKCTDVAVNGSKVVNLPNSVLNKKLLVNNGKSIYGPNHIIRNNQLIICKPIVSSCTLGSQPTFSSVQISTPLNNSKCSPQNPSNGSVLPVRPMNNNLTIAKSETVHFKKILADSYPQVVGINKPSHKMQLNILKTVTVKQKHCSTPRKTAMNEKCEKPAEISIRRENEVHKILVSTLANSCKSMEETLHLLWKRLHFFLSPTMSEDYQNDLSTEIPLGRLRAVEFWCARNIRKELQTLKVPDWNLWTPKRIVSWARRSGFSLSPYIHGSNRKEIMAPPTSLSVLALDTKSNSEEGPERLSQNSDLDDSFIVVDSDEDAFKKVNGQQGDKVDVDSVAILDSDNGFQFIELILSKLRMKLKEEELVSGVAMAVASSLLWKATLCFMEDLLRSSYAAAVDHRCTSANHCKKKKTTNSNADSSLVEIKAQHVLLALMNGRPEFDLLSGSGLGRSEEFAEPPRAPTPLPEVTLTPIEPAGLDNNNFMEHRYSDDSDSDCRSRLGLPEENYDRNSIQSVDRPCKHNLSYQTRKRRRITDQETEAAVSSILPKKLKSEDSECSGEVFFNRTRYDEDIFCSSCELERTLCKCSNLSSDETLCNMEVDHITSLVSIFSFNQQQQTDMCSAQAHHQKEPLGPPVLALTA